MRDFAPLQRRPWRIRLSWLWGQALNALIAAGLLLSLALACGMADKLAGQ